MEVASTLLTDQTKLTSSSVKARWRVECAPRMPKGRSWPGMGTLMPLVTPCARSTSQGTKRVSAARSSTTSGALARSENQLIIPGSVRMVMRGRMSGIQDPAMERKTNSLRSGTDSSSIARSICKVLATSAAASSKSGCNSSPRRAERVS